MLVNSGIHLQKPIITSFPLHLAFSQNLKRRCDQEARDKHYSLEASKGLGNRKHNRYRDVNPYDHSRILLVRSAASDTDYINANLVKCERADRQYILTQGPLPLTVSIHATGGEEI